MLVLIAVSGESGWIFSRR